MALIRPCPFCRDGEPDCEECSGTNEIPIHTCPNRLVTAREIDIVAACHMVEHAVLPDPGGWQDQPATFVRAYPIVTREIAHWQHVHHEQAMKKAQRR